MYNYDIDISYNISDETHETDDELYRTEFLRAFNLMNLMI